MSDSQLVDISGQPMSHSQFVEYQERGSVSAGIDPCYYTPLWAEIDADGRPRGDLNLDCEVDLRDTAIMQRSLTGP